MHKIAESEEYTSEHPNIHFLVHTVSEERIHNLWWSVHWCCVLLQLVFIQPIIGLRHCSEIHRSIRARAEVAQFVGSILALQDILYLNVAVGIANTMQPCYSLGNALDYTQQVFLLEAGVLLGDHFIEECPGIAHFHQNDDNRLGGRLLYKIPTIEANQVGTWLHLLLKIATATTMTSSSNRAASSLSELVQITRLSANTSLVRVSTAFQM
jgi:hypothetical protein